MKSLAIVFSCFLLAACATPTHYQQLPWAKISADQAWAECQYEAQANPLIGYQACMEKKGWRAIY